MEFAFETHYDHHALKAMARALRKTVRGKRSRRSGVWGAAVMVLGILLIITADDFGVRQIITAAAVISILLASLFQDGINAYFARKRGLPGTEHVITEFSENSYHS